MRFLVRRGFTVTRVTNFFPEPTRYTHAMPPFANSVRRRDANPNAKIMSFDAGVVREVFMVRNVFVFTAKQERLLF